MAALLWLLSLAPQEEYAIRKAHKEPYLSAAQSCEKAARILDSDPAGAIGLLDAVLDNASVEKRECRLKIERAPDEWTPWYDFYPYQFRGRARLVLAERNPDQAEAHLRSAISDLQESIRRGLKSSEEYVRKAKERLERLNLLREWSRLVGENRFRSAKKLLDGRADLSAEFAETESRCREFVRTTCGTFVGNLAGRSELIALPEKSFAARFALPSADELIVRTPVFEWCVAARGTLERMRKGEDVLEAMLDSAVAALPLEGPRSFLWAEELAYGWVAEGIDLRTEKSIEVSDAELNALRKEAEALRDRWPAFEKSPAPSRAKDLAARLNRFPRSERIEEIAVRLKATFAAADPKEALRKLENDLEVLRGEWGRLSRDSRKGVITFRILAGALRGFLEEKTAEQIATELFGLKSHLAAVGEPLPVALDYGEKVRAVFDRLGRVRK